VSLTAPRTPPGTATAKGGVLTATATASLAARLARLAPGAVAVAARAEGAEVEAETASLSFQHLLAATAPLAAHRPPPRIAPDSQTHHLRCRS